MIRMLLQIFSTVYVNLYFSNTYRSKTHMHASSIGRKLRMHLVLDLHFNHYHARLWFWNRLLYTDVHIQNTSSYIYSTLTFHLSRPCINLLNFILFQTKIIRNYQQKVILIPLRCCLKWVCILADMLAGRYNVDNVFKREEKVNIKTKYVENE